MVCSAPQLPPSLSWVVRHNHGRSQHQNPFQMHVLLQEEQTKAVRRCLEAVLQLLSRISCLGSIEAFFTADDLLQHYQHHVDKANKLTSQLQERRQQVGTVLHAGALCWSLHAAAWPLGVLSALAGQDAYHLLSANECWAAHSDHCVHLPWHWMQHMLPNMYACSLAGMSNSGLLTAFSVCTCRDVHAERYSYSNPAMCTSSSHIRSSLCDWHMQQQQHTTPGAGTAAAHPGIIQAAGAATVDFCLCPHHVIVSCQRKHGCLAAEGAMHGQWSMSGAV